MVVRFSLGQRDVSDGYAPNSSSYIGRGLYFQLMYGAAENASGTPALGRYTGGRVGYASGPANVALAHSRSKGPPAYGATTPTSEFTETSLGASWDIGLAKLMGRVGTNEADRDGSEYRFWGIGATIPVGPGYIPVSYNATKRNNAASGGASQLAVGYVYPLSRRTAMYTSFARLRNKGADTFTFRGGNGGTSGLVGGGSGTGYDIGVRHSF